MQTSTQQRRYDFNPNYHPPSTKVCGLTFKRFQPGLRVNLIFLREAVFSSLSKIDFQLITFSVGFVLGLYMDFVTSVRDYFCVIFVPS